MDLEAPRDEVLTQKTKQTLAFLLHGYGLVCPVFMSDAQFPSGQWFGFYTYHGRAKRYLMDLILEFKHGKMTGEGADGIGLFVISGRDFTGQRRVFVGQTIRGPACGGL
jgi:hypothetical protein